MERKDVTKRFNNMPIEHRTTIIGYSIEQEIRWIEDEKKRAMKEQQRKFQLYNERLKVLTNALSALNDD